MDGALLACYSLNPKPYKNNYHNTVSPNVGWMRSLCLLESLGRDVGNYPLYEVGL